MATVTATVTSIVTKTVASAFASSTVKVAAQGGILEGSNPTHYDSKNPIILFIIQAGIIIIFCRLLHWPLSKIRQPRVIAEVIGGVLLGPSVMGRIPGFTDTIFPAAATPNLSLIANLGLVLFLFIVGLEVDLRYLASNWKVAISVGAAGMVLPFGLGCAIAHGLYHEFRDEPGTEPVAFGTYVLFIGVAMAITAFPVLCRILTELKLLSTPVGIIVLSAGVGNDVVGWILLALCVALVNSGSGLTALWVLLTALGYTLFLIYAVRPAFMWVLRRTRSFENGPSQGVVALTLLIALTSSFFTGVIGIHPIFGAFMAGLICPHDGGFAIKVTEKIEDLVSALFLPLYFALSGLSTNLGLLDTGITWAYVVGVIAVAFLGKFVAAALAARVNGLVWRESFTIGALMSCKGLVELIVLNIGLQAKILSQRTFTIFVVMALVTTFATTPLTVALYPPSYQKKLDAWKKGLIDWETGRSLSDAGDDVSVVAAKLESAKVKDLLVYLRLDNMPALLTFVSLLGGRPNDVKRIHPAKSANGAVDENTSQTYPPKRPVEVHGVRMMELTERDSSVMQVSEADEHSSRDPIINTFRNFGRLYNLVVSGEVVVAPEASFAEMLAAQASRDGSDLLLLPWNETGSMSERQQYFDTTQKQRDSTSYSTFVTDALKAATCNTAILVNRGFGGNAPEQRTSPLRRTPSALSMRSHREKAIAPVPDRSHHIFMPYFGGADGRVALRLVLQIAENPDITATIIHFENPSTSSALDGDSSAAHTDTVQFGSSMQGSKSNQVLQESTELQEKDSSFFESLQRSLPAELASRVILDSVQTTKPVDDAIARAEIEVAQNPKNAGDLIVLGRRATSLFGSSSANGSLGAAADHFNERGLKASILVVQARSNSSD